MSKQTEALKLALDALEDYAPKVCGAAITAIKEALAEQPAQQEPIGKWMGNAVGWIENPYKFRKGQLIYTSPPASKPWVGLTELEALGAYEAEQQGRWGDHVRGLLAVEAKLREKNT